MGDVAATRAFLLLGLVGMGTACSSSLAVTRSFSPADAMAAQGGRLTVVAVERGRETRMVPLGAHIEADRVYWPNDPGEHTVHLLPGDVIQKDADGRIVAVRSTGADPILTRFVPGTASSPVGVAEVTGRLADDLTVIPLRASDRVRMTGTFENDEPIPGGGHPKTTRSTGLIVGGAVLLALVYAPNVYVGATSPVRSDKDLLIPLAGPWIDLAARPKCVPPAGSQALPISPCIVETISKVAIGTGGALEALGAVLIAVGIPSTTRISYEGDRFATRKPTLEVLPGTGSDGMGLHAAGTF
jgi:hypothetical protein